MNACSSALYIYMLDAWTLHYINAILSVDRVCQVIAEICIVLQESDAICWSMFLQGDKRRYLIFPYIL